MMMLKVASLKFLLRCVAFVCFFRGKLFHLNLFNSVKRLRFGVCTTAANRFVAEALYVVTITFCRDILNSIKRNLFGLLSGVWHRERKNRLLHHFHAIVKREVFAINFPRSTADSFSFLFFPINSN